MRVLALSLVGLALAAVLVHVLGQHDSNPKDTVAGDASVEKRGGDPAQASPVLLQAPPSAAPAVRRTLAPQRQLTPEQRAAREEWERQLARDETLVAAGLLSADEADTNRLNVLVERRVSGEMTEVEYHQARAEIHARRVARREALYAAGLLDERELREARLVLAEALAGDAADDAHYAAAWRDHFDWLKALELRAAEAGRVDGRTGRGWIEEFLRERPWPTGTADDAERTFAPYLRPRWGWVRDVVGGAEGSQRVRIVFGGPTPLKVGHERDLYRSDVPVATVRVIELERDGAVVLAEVVSHLPGSAPRPGDIAISN